MLALAAEAAKKIPPKMDPNPKKNSY